MRNLKHLVYQSTRTASFLRHIPLFPRRRPQSRRLISIRFPRHTTFRSRVNATPVENSIIAATIYAHAGLRTTNAHSSLKWKRAPSSCSSLCASMAREMYVADGGGFHKRRYFRAVRPCAIMVSDL